MPLKAPESLFWEHPKFQWSLTTPPFFGARENVVEVLGFFEAKGWSLSYKNPHQNLLETTCSTSLDGRRVKQSAKEKPASQAVDSMANPLPNFEEIIQLLDKETGYVSTPNIKYDIPSIPTLVNPTFKNLSRVSNLVLMPCWTLKKKKPTQALKAQSP